MVARLLQREHRSLGGLVMRLFPLAAEFSDPAFAVAVARFPFAALGALYARTRTKWSSRLRDM